MRLSVRTMQRAAVRRPTNSSTSPASITVELLLVAAIRRSGGGRWRAGGGGPPGGAGRRGLARPTARPSACSIPSRAPGGHRPRKKGGRVAPLFAGDGRFYGKTSAFFVVRRFILSRAH